MHVCMYVACRYECMFVGCCLATKTLKAHISKHRWSQGALGDQASNSQQNCYITIIGMHSPMQLMHPNYGDVQYVSKNINISTFLFPTLHLPYLTLRLPYPTLSLPYVPPLLPYPTLPYLTLPSHYFTLPYGYPTSVDMYTVTTICMYVACRYECMHICTYTYATMYACL